MVGFLEEGSVWSASPKTWTSQRAVHVDMGGAGMQWELSERVRVTENS